MERHDKNVDTCSAGGARSMKKKCNAAQFDARMEARRENASLDLPGLARRFYGNGMFPLERFKGNSRSGCSCLSSGKYSVSSLVSNYFEYILFEYLACLLFNESAARMWKKKGRL